MNKFFRAINQNYLIILIIFIAAYLRFKGIYPGYPEHTDEAGFSSALTMLFKGNLDPGRYDYPAGLPLIHLLLFKFFFIPLGWIKFYFQSLGTIVDGFMNLPLNPVEHQRVFHLNILGEREINVMYWGRYITAICGVGIVISIYKLVYKIFNKTSGLIVAFLVAVNFRQVLNSHLGLPDIYNSFFLILTIYSFYKLIENPSKINYFLSGFLNALYFSIKFQTFGFIPLLTVHFISSWRLRVKSDTIMKNINRIIFSSKLFVSILTSAFVMAFLNPYLFVKFEIFRGVQMYQLSKYGIGSDSLYMFPISYLFHIGIGQLISILVVIGFVYSFIKYFKKTLIINLCVLQFMLMFLYLSRGGFYTRNFVTITPILLIYSAVVINDAFELIFKNLKTKWLHAGFLSALLIFLSSDNIKNSMIVGNEYSQTWNKNIISEWINKNIPYGSVVAAHSNTPLPDTDKRLTFELDDSFSIDEFAASGAEYAVSNSAWTTNSFYWWMGGGVKDYIKHLWNKPVDVLEYSYPALALRELEQFNVYSISNPWQAPDTDFLVAKIPVLKVISKESMQVFDFNESTNGWNKAGTFWTNANNMFWGNGALVIHEDPATLPSLRWESAPIQVSDWKGFQVDYKIKSEKTNKNLRTGYIFVNYYKNIDDAKNSKNRIGLRLSERNMIQDRWIEKSLVGQLPNDAKYITIGFYNYAPAQSETMLDYLSIYKANVTVDFDGVDIHPVFIDQNNLFPNSHGNL